MLLWTFTTPFRDGGLDSGILIHELSHGLSSRLTGGPMNAGCVLSGEAGGLGEGWSDYIATSVRSTSTYRDYPSGVWARNKTEGIRSYPYSTVKISGFDSAAGTDIELVELYDQSSVVQ